MITVNNIIDFLSHFLRAAEKGKVWAGETYLEANKIRILGKRRSVFGEYCQEYSK